MTLATPTPGFDCHAGNPIKLIIAQGFGGLIPIQVVGAARIFGGAIELSGRRPERDCMVSFDRAAGARKSGPRRRLAGQTRPGAPLLRCCRSRRDGGSRPRGLRSARPGLGRRPPPPARPPAPRRDRQPMPLPVRSSVRNHGRIALPTENTGCKKVGRGDPSPSRPTLFRPRF